VNRSIARTPAPWNAVVAAVVAVCACRGPNNSEEVWISDADVLSFLGDSGRTDNDPEDIVSGIFLGDSPNDEYDDGYGCGNDCGISSARPSSNVLARSIRDTVSGEMDGVGTPSEMFVRKSRACSAIGVSDDSGDTAAATGVGVDVTFGEPSGPSVDLCAVAAAAVVRNTAGDKLRAIGVTAGTASADGGREIDGVVPRLMLVRNCNAAAFRSDTSSPIHVTARPSSFKVWG
jgi:hypothetical protein